MGVSGYQTMITSSDSEICKLIKDAEILHKFKSNRHALALTVLSDVELGKAVIYHLWSKGLIARETTSEIFRRFEITEEQAKIYLFTLLNENQ
jgi:AbiV family abortive infection protein